MEPWFQKIEDYLNGQMSSNEQLLFETEMAKNEALASAVTVYRQIETDMRQGKKYGGDENKLRQTISNLNALYFKNETRQNIANLPVKETNPFKQTTPDAPPVKALNQGKLNWGYKVAIAAGITGVMAFGITMYLKNKPANSSSEENTITDTLNKKNKPDTFFFKQNSSKDAIVQNDTIIVRPDKNGKNIEVANLTTATLFAANFKPDAAPVEKEGPLEKAFVLYENKKYIEAIVAINEADINIVTRGEEDEQKFSLFYTAYYKALSYMATDHIQSAIPELKNAIVNSPDNTYLVKARWYLSLAYIKTGELKKAHVFLEQLANNHTHSSYQTKAQQLKEQLKQIK